MQTMAEKDTHDLFARIPEELFQRLKVVAKKHKRSVTAEVEWVIQQHVEANEEAPKRTRKPKAAE